MKIDDVKDDINKAFLANEWNSFHLLGKKQDNFHLKDFPKYKCGLYPKQPLHHRNAKIIATYRTLSHRLAIEIGRWTTIPSSRDTRLCHFWSHNVVENEAHFVLECPLYNPIKNKFSSLFKEVIQESLKSFFQLDHQVNVSLYLTEATTLRHSKNISWLETLVMYFQSQ